MSELDRVNQLYRDTILDHYRDPRNAKPFEDPDATASVNNPFCGDAVTVQLAVQDARIERVAVLGEGCSICQSSASLMGEAIRGKTLGEAQELRTQFRALMAGEDLSPAVVANLGDLAVLRDVRTYPVRVKCALLGWSALSEAVGELQHPGGTPGARSVP